MQEQLPHVVEKIKYFEEEKSRSFMKQVFDNLITAWKNIADTFEIHGMISETLSEECQSEIADCVNGLQQETHINMLNARVEKLVSFLQEKINFFHQKIFSSPNQFSVLKCCSIKRSRYSLIHGFFWDPYLPYYGYW